MVIIERKVAGLSEDALTRFVLRARRAAKLRGGVDVLITSSDAMKALNVRFRRMNKATDVLSFPAEESNRRGAVAFAGELAISGEIAVENAKRLGHQPVLEIKVLVLHGILHLAGFDHERDNGQMARLEAKLRRTLNLPVALIERANSSADDGGKSRRHVPSAKRARRTA